MTLTNLFILGYWIFLYKFKRHLKTKQNSVTFHKLFVLHYSSKSIYSVNAFRKLRGARKKVNTRWRELIRRVLRTILLLRRCVWVIRYEHEFLSLSCTKKYFSLTCVYKISSVRVTCLFRLIERGWIFLSPQWSCAWIFLAQVHAACTILFSKIIHPCIKSQIFHLQIESLRESFEKKITLNEHTGTLSFLRVAATTSPKEPAPRSFPISKFAKSAEIDK